MHTEKRKNLRAVFTFLWLLVGIGITVGLLSLLFLEGVFAWYHNEFVYPLVVLLLCYSVIAYSTYYMRRFPYFSAWKVIFFLSFICFLVSVPLIKLANRGFPLLYVLLFFVIESLLLLGWNAISRRMQYWNLALVAGGIADELSQVDSVNYSFTVVTSPQTDRLPDECEGVVIDTLQKSKPEWIRFISDCQLSGMQVIQAEDIYEVLTGRVSLTHLSEGMVRNYSTGGVYLILKRAIDLVVVIASAPISLLVLCACMIWIRVESHGPALFTQERIGQGGKPFVIYKLRTMYSDSAGDYPSLGGQRDSRITRIGRLLRRFRLDEVPQFWNIMKGDMSLIGPRPEQVEFADSYLRQIPYYSYRHLVRPGIAGWAQVCQGYTSNVEETKEKLMYDFYYIKHLSFWLDTLVALKAVRTVFTGFGAR